MAITKEQVLDVLQTVYDPELGVDIVNLGLIYEVDILGDAENDVHVQMTLTTNNCPLTESMPAAATRAIETLEGVGAVKVDLVWNPPWQPEMMTPLGLSRLGGMGGMG